MAKNSLNDYSTTPANNTDIAGTNINVNCPPSDVGIYMRTQMAQLADVIAGNVPLTKWYVVDLYVDTLHLTNSIAYVNLTPSGYVTVGSPTGGGQGTGTINVTGYYLNGVALTTTFPFSQTLNWAQAAVVANGTVIYTTYAPYAGTIAALKYSNGSAGGSFTANVRINGTSVTSLSAVNVASASSATATGANTFVAGDTIDVVISAVSGTPTDAYLTIRGTRS
jgi:hypothetical protein